MSSWRNPCKRSRQDDLCIRSPRTWDNLKLKLPNWIKELRDKKDFGDVRYYDGVQLEAWLDERAGVAAHHARAILGRVPQTGARSTSEFWNEYSQRFRPALTEEVVLCARETQAEQIVTHLLGKPGPLVLTADGPDEVTAVAVAAIRKAVFENRAFLEARTLIADSEEAGRALGIPNRYKFVVSPAANKVSGYLSGFGPIGVGFDAVYRPRILRHRFAVRQPAGLCPSGRVGIGLASGVRVAR